MVGIASLVATFALGPTDLGRSVYNQIIGDTPVLKRQLVEYCRRDMMSTHPWEPASSIERRLGNELRYHFQNAGPESETLGIDPNQVSIETLWDASEDHAQSLYNDGIRFRRVQAS